MEKISESEKKRGEVVEICSVDKGSKKDETCKDETSGNAETRRPISKLSCLHLDYYTSLQSTKDYRNIHSHCVACTSIEELLWKRHHCYCYICETRCHRLHACLICPYFGCYENNHIQEHFAKSEHFLAVDVTTGNIYCFECEDYVYDHRYEHISRRQKVKRGKYIASWFPTETVKLIDKKDVFYSKDYLYQDPYVPKDIGEFDLYVGPGGLKFLFNVHFKKRNEGSVEEDEYNSYEDEKEEEKEKLETEKKESTFENAEKMSQDITDVETTQLEPSSLNSKPKSPKSRRNKKSRGKSSKAKSNYSCQSEKRERIEVCDLEPLKGVFGTVSQDVTGNERPEILTSSSCSEQETQQSLRKIKKKREIGLPQVTFDVLDKEEFEAIISEHMQWKSHKQRAKLIHRKKELIKEIKICDKESPEEAVETRNKELTGNETPDSETLKPKTHQKRKKRKEKRKKKKSDLEQHEEVVETMCQDLTKYVTLETETSRSILKQKSHPKEKKRVTFNMGEKLIPLKKMSQGLTEDEEILTLIPSSKPNIEERLKEEKMENSDLKPLEEVVEAMCEDLTENVTLETETLRSILKRQSQPEDKKKKKG